MRDSRLLPHCNSRCGHYDKLDLIINAANKMDIEKAVLHGRKDLSDQVILAEDKVIQNVVKLCK